MELLQKIENDAVEVHLQSWPSDEVIGASVKVLLIGISSSRVAEWTHKDRIAPATPRADAWIHVPGKVLIVFECKNDDHPLDATQMSAYAHKLGLVIAGTFPCAKPGLSLDEPEARLVQVACANLIVDTPWHAVTGALKRIQHSTGIGSIGRWLAEQAADYIERHVRPPYEGPKTILAWLDVPNDEDRREYLRYLLRQLGKVVESAKGQETAITFKQKKGTGDQADSNDQDLDLPTGAGSGVYLRLCRNGEPIFVTWLGKEAPLVLWFQFNAEESKRVGVEYYVQAKGAQPDQKKDVDSVRAWTAASEKHKEHAANFYKDMGAWVSKAPPGCAIEVTTVGFRGRSRSWRGSGETVPEGPQCPPHFLSCCRFQSRSSWNAATTGMLYSHSCSVWPLLVSSSTSL